MSSVAGHGALAGALFGNVSNWALYILLMLDDLQGGGLESGGVGVAAFVAYAFISTLVASFVGLVVGVLLSLFFGLTRTVHLANWIMAAGFLFLVRTWASLWEALIFAAIGFVAGSAFERAVVLNSISAGTRSVFRSSRYDDALEREATLL